MNGSHAHTYPKLHNAAWPGVVGKGGEGAEPCIDLDTMLDLTAAARCDDAKFDGFDLFLYLPHINIDASDDEIKSLADKSTSRGLVIGSVVAPVGSRPAAARPWTREGRKKFLEQVRRDADRQAVARAGGRGPTASCGSTRRAARTTGSPTRRATRRRSPRRCRQAGAIARDHGEKLAAEGEICGAACTPGGPWSTSWSGWASPRRSDSRRTWPTRCSTRWGECPEDRILPKDFQWKDHAALDAALKTLTSALRPWTIDFHVAQNDATVFGSGSHDHTGRHCLANDPNGKLDIPHHAGFWLRDENGKLTRKFKHICWDGCMFPNEVMMRPETWNNILAAMVQVRDAHGWNG
ncbi:MAG: sugar phosphate isomerase/epimerase [Isosphaeraceae bacterium]